MKMTFDRNVFTQIGLDSGSLTMLSTVVHSFKEAGEYRGTVRGRADPEAVFYISVDKTSPVAQANIDLSTLTASTASEERCGDGSQTSESRLNVNPKGYVVFHVSAGAGGYYVHVRKADESPDTPIFDSRQLNDGDIFSAVILRPGEYSVTNFVTKARAEIIVPYPRVGKTGYRPPPPIRVQCDRKRFNPGRLEVHPGQGLIFDCKAASRIKIDLLKPNDGPGQTRK